MTVAWSIHSEGGATGGVSAVEDAPAVIGEHLELFLGQGERHMTVRVCEDVADVVDAAFEQGYAAVARLRAVARDPEHPHQLSALGDLRTIGAECWL